MTTIYLDNYRGFTDTHITLKEVNFLVGENSTGKSSFLSIIQLLSESAFWLSLTFNTESVHLGGFDDIVSQINNKREFSIGLYQEDFGEDKKSDNDLIAFLMRFEPKEGQPTLSQFNYLTKEKEVRINLSNSQIRYGVEDIGDLEQGALTPAIFFYKWLDKEQEPAREYLIENPPIGPIWLILPNLINIESSRQNQKPYPQSLLTLPFIGQNALQIRSLASIKANMPPTYNGRIWSEGNHTPYFLHRYLASDKKKQNEIIAYLEKFGQKSGVFEGLSIKSIGLDQSKPFALRILMNGRPYTLSSQGVGVSHSLPMMTEILSKPNGTWFAVQQPEVHLHPKAQAALGEFIFDAYRLQDKKFVIETHSDFIIDRFRIKVREYNRDNDSADKKQISSQVLFFERTEKGNQVHSIEIDEEGEYSEEQPPTFREFFIMEELAVLGL